MKHTKKKQFQVHHHQKHKRSIQSKSVCFHLLRKKYPNVEVHTLSSAIKQQLVEAFHRPLRGSVRKTSATTADITYFDLFRMLSGFDHKSKKPYLVFIKGGFVRDIVQGKPIDEIHDIDIVYTKPFNTVRYGKYGLNALNIQYTSFKDTSSKYYYIKIGSDAKDSHSVDCTFTPLHDYTQLEAPVNMMMINVSYLNESCAKELGSVYDITGRGWQHAKQRIWDAPSRATLRHSEWLNAAKLWRMLKFQLRGYSVPLSTKKHIYRHWLKYHEQFPDYNWINVWHKQFSTIGENMNETVELTKKAVHRLFTLVISDFSELKFKVSKALEFVKMLIVHNMLTVPSRLRDLRRINTHRKIITFTKRKSAKLNSSVEELTMNNPEINELLQYLNHILSLKHMTTSLLFDTVEMLLKVNLITTFPIITLLHVAPSQAQSYKPLYTYPELSKDTPCLIFPLRESSKTTLANVFEHNQLSAVTPASKPISMAQLFNKLLHIAHVKKVCLYGTVVDDMIQHNTVLYQNMRVAVLAQQNVLSLVHSSIVEWCASNKVLCNVSGADIHLGKHRLRVIDETKLNNEGSLILDITRNAFIELQPNALSSVLNTV